MMLSKTNFLVYVGTYTTGASEGIYAFLFNAAIGELISLGPAARVPNPPYLALHPFKRILYSIMDTGVDGTIKGAVGAFRIEDSTGRLHPLNHVVLPGEPPCHINPDPAGRYLFAANYREGTISVFTLRPDGGVGSLVDTVVHHGAGPHPERQTKAYAHYAALTPGGEYLAVVDLGMDRIVMYDLKPDRLVPREDLSIQTPPGSGPRHLTFDSSGKFVYLLTELSSEVIVYEYAPLEPWRRVQIISALPAGYSGTTIGAAIHLSPDGRFVYTSNRGHDSIAVFRIDAGSGQLELVSHTNSQGEFPRDFAIDPGGRFLIAANERSDSLALFERNPETGRLSYRSSHPVPTPTCVKFV